MTHSPYERKEMLEAARYWLTWFSKEEISEFDANPKDIAMNAFIAGWKAALNNNPTPKREQGEALVTFESKVKDFTLSEPTNQILESTKTSSSEPKECDEIQELCEDVTIDAIREGMAKECDGLPKLEGEHEGCNYLLPKGMSVCMKCGQCVSNTPSEGER